MAEALFLELAKRDDAAVEGDVRGAIDLLRDGPDLFGEQFHRIQRLEVALPISIVAITACANASAPAPPGAQWCGETASTPCARSSPSIAANSASVSEVK